MNDNKSDVYIIKENTKRKKQQQNIVKRKSQIDE